MNADQNWINWRKAGHITESTRYACANCGIRYEEFRDELPGWDKCRPNPNPHQSGTKAWMEQKKCQKDQSTSETPSGLLPSSDGAITGSGAIGRGRKKVNRTG